MGKNVLKYFIVFILVVATFGCRGLKKRKKTESVNSEVNMMPSSIQKSDSIYRKDWNFLSGKAGVDFNDGNQDISASINFRMKKDSIVWVLATYLGFEVARVKIDKDSAYIINRTGSSYYVYGLNELNAYLGVNVTLRQFQNILIANPVLDTFTYDVLPSAPNKMFIQSDKQLKNTLGVNPKGMLIFESILQAVSTSTQRLDIDYKNYSNDGGLLVPRNIGMVAASNQKVIKIGLDIKSINVEPIDSYPFNIPASYERKN